MITNQETFNEACEAAIAQLNGTAKTDVLKLEWHYEQMFEACNPLAYDSSDQPAVPTVAQYAKLFNFGFTAITDADGETLTFAENTTIDSLADRFDYLIAYPRASSSHRTQAANQAVLAEMLNMLRRTAGNASDELAFYAIGVMEDALSPHNPAPAVLTDDYRDILTDVLAAFKEDGAAEAVCDRLETLLTQRSATKLIVDAEGVAKPDAGKWD